jgi:CheY-like chemotaxis protein
MQEVIAAPSLEPRAGTASAGGHALILMDLQMPNLNGIDATRAIRHAPGVKRVPIIALTASAFDQDRQRCMEAGMDDHIAKPLNPEIHSNTISRWLRQPAAGFAGTPPANER